MITYSISWHVCRVFRAVYRSVFGPLLLSLRGIIACVYRSFGLQFFSRNLTLTNALCTYGSSSNHLLNNKDTSSMHPNTISESSFEHLYAQIQSKNLVYQSFIRKSIPSACSQNNVIVFSQVISICLTINPTASRIALSFSNIT